MGLIEEIVRGMYARAMYPVYCDVQKQFKTMQEQSQRVALSQAVMEVAYENQCIRERLNEDFEESLRCWFKRNIP